jgi:DNA-binding transcriptional LysR family regulator
MAQNLDIQLLRHFVAVAEELHFSRAADRLYVAQQVLSRDVRALEAAAGVRLLDRTTRRVELTAAGHELLGRARQILALHDATVHELRGDLASLLVDVVGVGLTPTVVLEEARRMAPGIDFFARFHTGVENGVSLVRSGALDVTFGRAPTASRQLQSQLVRYERFGVLLPEQHPLAAREQIPLAQLRDSGVCFRAGDQATPGWEDAALQLLAPLGIDAASAHPHVLGMDDLQHHLRQRNAPILTLMDQPGVAGAVRRPLVDPVPLYPWSMTWKTGAVHPGLGALREAAVSLSTASGWLIADDGAWLPE